jgi:hypothetical protein
MIAVTTRFWAGRGPEGSPLAVCRAVGEAHPASTTAIAARTDATNLDIAQPPSHTQRMTHRAITLDRTEPEITTTEARRVAFVYDTLKGTILFIFYPCLPSGQDYVNEIRVSTLGWLSSGHPHRR